MPCDEAVGFLSVLLLASNYFFGFGKYCRLINGGQFAIIQQELPTLPPAFIEGSPLSRCNRVVMPSGSSGSSSMGFHQ